LIKNKIPSFLFFAAEMAKGKITVF